MANATTHEPDVSDQGERENRTAALSNLRKRTVFESIRRLGRRVHASRLRCWMKWCLLFRQSVDQYIVEETVR